MMKSINIFGRLAAGNALAEVGIHLDSAQYRAAYKRVVAIMIESQARKMEYVYINEHGSEWDGHGCMTQSDAGTIIVLHNWYFGAMPRYVVMREIHEVRTILSAWATLKEANAWMFAAFNTHRHTAWVSRTTIKRINGREAVEYTAV